MSSFAIYNYQFAKIIRRAREQSPHYDLCSYRHECLGLSKDDAYLVTGNTKHFPKKPIVVTPAEMMKIVESL